MSPKTKNTRHPHVDPPFKHHTAPTPISPAEAQRNIAKYLSRSLTRPYLHPDSQLSTTGIRFAIGTGPKGGIALHHLRRIEAGLRGEVLEKETPEQLEALFGPQVGDDARLDGQIARSEAGLRKKKRKREEVEDWVSTSSQVDADDEGGLGYLGRGKEIESFAATPVHQPTYGGEGMEDAQDPYEYELQQRVWTKDPQSGEGGAVGSLVRQDGKVPEIKELSKEERKQAKKLRKEERRKDKAREAEESKVKETTKPESKKKAKAEDSDKMKTEDSEERTAKEARRAEKRAKKRKRESEEPVKPEPVESDVENEHAERERLRAEKKKRKKEKKAEKKAKRDKNE